MTLRYSSDRTEIVRLARERGLSDGEILKALLANEYGQRARAQIVREWAEVLGLSEEEALAIARRAGLLT